MEDILQQEPREKLEIFPKLGYYFVVFRAIEGQKSRQRFQSRQGGGDLASGPGDEGIIGAVNVYLVVFREGICSVSPCLPFSLSHYSQDDKFHFEDISGEHDRRRMGGLS